MSMVAFAYPLTHQWTLDHNFMGIPLLLSIALEMFHGSFH